MPSVSREPARGEERVAVGDGHVAVDHARVVRRRPEVLADALDEVRMDLLVGVDRADRVGADDLDRRVLLLQVAADAGDRAAGADADDEVRDLAAGLAPQLRARSSRSGSAGWPGSRTGWAGRRRGSRASGGRRRGSRTAGESGGDVGRRDHDLGAVGAQQVDLLARTSCPASPRSRGSPSGARRSPGRCRCCPRSAR